MKMAKQLEARIESLIEYISQVVREVRCKVQYDNFPIVTRRNYARGISSNPENLARMMSLELPHRLTTFVRQIPDTDRSIVARADEERGFFLVC